MATSRENGVLDGHTRPGQAAGSSGPKQVRLSAFVDRSPFLVPFLSVFTIASYRNGEAAQPFRSQSAENGLIETTL